LQIKTKNVSSHTGDSKPVKQEVNCTRILPPLVFPGLAYLVATSVTKKKKFVTLALDGGEEYEGTTPSTFNDVIADADADADADDATAGSLLNETYDSAQCYKSFFAI
jgi:hypothetical protein